MNEKLEVTNKLTIISLVTVNHTKFSFRKWKCPPPTEKRIIFPVLGKADFCVIDDNVDYTQIPERRDTIKREFNGNRHNIVREIYSIPCFKIPGNSTNFKNLEGSIISLMFIRAEDPNKENEDRRTFSLDALNRAVQKVSSMNTKVRDMCKDANLKCGSKKVHIIPFFSGVNDYRFCLLINVDRICTLVQLVKEIRRSVQNCATETITIVGQITGRKSYLSELAVDNKLQPGYRLYAKYNRTSPSFDIKKSFISELKKTKVRIRNPEDLLRDENIGYWDDILSINTRPCLTPLNIIMLIDNLYNDAKYCQKIYSSVYNNRGS